MLIVLSLAFVKDININKAEDGHIEVGCSLLKISDNKIEFCTTSEYIKWRVI